MLAVGDLILGQPNAGAFFELAAPVLRTADVVVGQAERLFTSRGIEARYLDIPKELITGPACHPDNMNALTSAGFDVLTLAGNHVWDSGLLGIVDTIAGLERRGIAFTGIGMNLDEARRPAIIEREGTRFGFLSYNCVGPKITWATPEKPGCPFVRIITAPEPEYAFTPGDSPTIYTFAEPESLEAMSEDIRKLGPLCDILVVALHKGVGFTPAVLAMYEKPVSHAAIRAGADLVLGHHSHILRGIEFYQGKPIFHGLGHFVLALPKIESPSFVRQEYAKKRKAIRSAHAMPDPDYPNYPWHRDTLMTIIAKCIVENRQISRVGFLPCLINKDLQPEILGNDPRGQQVFAHMDQITQAARLNAVYEWEGNEVMVRQSNGNRSN